MSLSPSGPKELLDYALRLCAENSQRMGAIASGDNARLAALGIVAHASATSASVPLGVTLAQMHPPLSPTRLATPQRSPAVAAAAARTTGPQSAAAASLKQQSPPTALADCPYCNEPSRPFCPESGRRHETHEERGMRLWRVMFRFLQFSSRVAQVERLSNPNTCSEEFYIEL